MSGQGATRQQHGYQPYDRNLVEVKSKFELEFRRFSIDRTQMIEFQEFYTTVLNSHNLPSEMNFTVSYTDPRNGDLLPITNNDNMLRAFSTAMPLLKVFLYREQDLMFEDMKAKDQRKVKKTFQSQRPILKPIISGPKEFRKVGSIVDADLLPDSVRRVKLVKYSKDRQLGFYIRDGTSIRVTPYGLEKVPGVFISRLVPGGVAELTGLLSVDDEVIEVNGIEILGKTLDQVTDMMIANGQNLIITVKPINQLPPSPRMKSSSTTRPTHKGSPSPKGIRRHSYGPRTSGGNSTSAAVQPAQKSSPSPEGAHIHNDAPPTSSGNSTSATTQPAHKSSPSPKGSHSHSNALPTNIENTTPQTDLATPSRQTDPEGESSSPTLSSKHDNDDELVTTI